MQRRGPLIVFSKKLSEATHAFRNLPGVDCVSVNSLSVLSLAPGGHVGRFVIWSRDAFAQLDAMFGTGRKASTMKSGYNLPRPVMKNADVARLINSDEVQAVVRPKKEQSKRAPRKKNPLTNLGALLKLNPYAKTVKRHATLFQEARLAKKAGIQKCHHTGKETKADPKAAPVVHTAGAEHHSYHHGHQGKHKSGRKSIGAKKRGHHHHGKGAHGSHATKGHTKK